jgi:hypothetical protein
MNYLNNSAVQAPAAAEQAKLDEQARRAGFRDYDQMRAYMMQRQNKTGGTVPARGPQADASVETAMSWHPAVVFDKISSYFDKALGK